MAKRPSPAPAAPPSAADQVELDLVKSALRKKQAGDVPNERELRALRRYEKQREDERRRSYYATVPKGHYGELSGRQAKVLNEQADRYQLPLRGRTVDLFAVVRRFHDLLAEWSRGGVPGAAADEDEMSGPASPMLERWREEKWRLARMERRRLEGSLVDRAEIDGLLIPVAQRLQRASEQLGRRYGADAQAILAEAIEEVIGVVSGEGVGDGDGVDAAKGDARS